MHEDDPRLAEELAALKATFCERLTEDIAAFRALLAQPIQPPPLTDLCALSGRAHRLAGAAGSFGEAALSVASVCFEKLCEEGGAAELTQALSDLALESERVLKISRKAD